VVACAAASGCPSSPPAAVDAAAIVRPAPVDAGARARSGRRRRRRPTAQTPGAQVAANEPTEMAYDEGPAPPRPRVTETGPVLPEDLGPPPSQELDMTQGGATGPMGLEPSQIRRAMDPLLPRMSACAEATTDESGRGPRGRVGVRLRVHGDGRPVAARVSGGGGTAEFVTCVRRVVASARFDHFAGPDVFATWGFDVD
jgi:hypothetical protein